jgi:hypothetical protein
MVRLEPGTRQRRRRPVWPLHPSRPTASFGRSRTRAFWARWVSPTVGGVGHLLSWGGRGLGGSCLGVACGGELAECVGDLGVAVVDGVLVAQGGGGGGVAEAVHEFGEGGAGVGGEDGAGVAEVVPAHSGRPAATRAG